MDTSSLGSWLYHTMMGAAIDLAHTPRAQFDVSLQEQILNRHGLSLDAMTDDEIDLLGRMATDYGRRIYG